MKGKKKNQNKSEKILPELGIIYEEKEKFIDIFESKITSDSAFWKLLEWTESAYQYFPKSCQTIILNPLIIGYISRQAKGKRQ